MSNILIIKAVEVKAIGASKALFGVIASDRHGTSIDFGYPSKDALFKAWPNRIAAARKVFAETAFDGTGYVDDADHIVLDAFAAIEFEGFPDSGALVVKQHSEIHEELSNHAL